jgi:hypothetical protein
VAIPYGSSFDITIPFSDTDAQLTLSATDVLTYTVPGIATQKYTVLFSYNATENVYVGLNVTPAVPMANSITTVSFVEFRPDKRYVKGGDVLSFITPDTTVYMGISLRGIPN